MKLTKAEINETDSSRSEHRPSAYWSWISFRGNPHIFQEIPLMFLKAYYSAINIARGSCPSEKQKKHRKHLLFMREHNASQSIQINHWGDSRVAAFKGPIDWVIWCLFHSSDLMPSILDPWEASMVSYTRWTNAGLERACTFFPNTINNWAPAEVIPGAGLIKDGDGAWRLVVSGPWRREHNLTRCVCMCESRNACAIAIAWSP